MENKLPTILPISDLRNNTKKISEEIHNSDEPVFLTKNGTLDMVVMSAETYMKNAYEESIYRALRESEIEAMNTPATKSLDEVKERFANKAKGGRVESA